MSTEITVEDGDRRQRALSPDDKKICINLLTFGFDYINRDLGWTADASSDFLARKEVQKELEYLKGLYLDREGHQERTRFFAQMKINSLVPGAVTVLAKALRGDQVKDDGQIDRAPTRAQYDASMQILDRANVATEKFTETNTVPTVDNRQVHLHAGDGASSEKISAFIKDVIYQAKSVGDKRVEGRKKRRKPKTEEEST